MQDIERTFMRTLRHIYDTEKQLVVSMRMIRASAVNRRLAAVLRDIEAQSSVQAGRIECIFRALYLEPTAEASWATTALLREAWDAHSLSCSGGSRGCAAALLAIKRYEITLYEALLRWSEDFELVEAIVEIRRCIAEELLQASILAELAFEADADRNTLAATQPAGALH